MADIMDYIDIFGLRGEKSLIMKTVKGASTGLVVGIVNGAFGIRDLCPPAERRTRPGMIRMIKLTGRVGVSTAALAGIYVGAEQLLQNFRNKQDNYNGAIGGFVAGASVTCMKRKYRYALPMGAMCAAGGALWPEFMKIFDSGKEHDPSTAKKGPCAD